MDRSESTGISSLLGGGADYGQLVPTPTCMCRGTPPTPEQTEGPYYKPDTPKKTSFREDTVGGTSFVVSGQIVNTDGEPVGGALLDFWQVDDSGIYDDDGYRMRGHQFADAEGRWRLETVVPAIYPSRTRHLHVKVQPPDGEVLTTMLYFPDERRNHLDKYFRPECLMDIRDTAEGKEATITIVVHSAHAHD